MSQQIRRYLAAVVVGLVASACASSPAAEHTRHEGAKNAVQLGSGTAAGTAWTLTAFFDGNGHLCLSLNTTVEDGACGNASPGSVKTDPYNVWPLDHSKTDLYFGPTPPGTKRVVLARRADADQTGCSAVTRRAVSTAPNPLPTWAPRGGWYVMAAPDDLIDCTEMQFLAASGKSLDHWAF